MGTTVVAVIDEDASRKTLLVAMGAHILTHLHEEFPAWNGHTLWGRESLTTPRERNPLFYGSYDWHSSVHSHWALVRLARLGLDPALSDRAIGALDRSFRSDLAAAEVSQWPKAMFHTVPYGATWFLKLMTELRLGSDIPVFREWVHNLQPLEKVVLNAVFYWLATLDTPVRSGQHADTAWSLARLLDWCDEQDAIDLRQEVANGARSLYGCDRDAPFLFESPADAFFSPLLNEAALMSRCLRTDDFGIWLRGFMPDLFTAGRIQIPEVPRRIDESHFVEAHVDALHLTRAKTMMVIASAVDSDLAHSSLKRVAAEQLDEGLSRMDLVDYSTGHWVATYGVWALT